MLPVWHLTLGTPLGEPLFLIVPAWLNHPCPDLKWDMDLPQPPPSPRTEPPASFRTGEGGWTRERSGQGKALQSEVPASPSEQRPPAMCQSWSMATGCSSALEAQGPQPPRRPWDLGGENLREKGRQAGSLPQSQWFQRINNSERKTYIAHDALCQPS